MISPHSFDTDEQPYPGVVRSCKVCQLPESRLDVHTFAETPAEVREAEARRLGETP